MNGFDGRIALTGPVQLELLEKYFREAGFDIAAPGEIPAVTWDVTSRERELAAETEGFYDPRLEKLAGCPYSLAGIEAVIEEFRWYLASPLRSGAPAKKILAVDADNTLWDGILSEDGPAALEPRTDFQRGIGELRDLGVLPVLVSKNDHDGFFESAAVKNLLVTPGLFTAVAVNWAPKAGNLLGICRGLGLGTDSVVFVDDNPHERAQMQAHLPAVTVAPWSGWQGRSASAERQLCRRLREYFFFDCGITAEDRLRAGDYRRRAAVEASAADFATRSDYLRDLGLFAEARRARSEDLDRLAQMAGKTNQFNATTLRRTREEFAAMLADPSSRVYVFRAGDRFGEQGTVCYVVVDLAAGRITDFVMSCRAMGRTLEHFAYRYVRDDLGYAPPVDFRPTPKNAPFAEFLKELAGGGEPVTYVACRSSRVESVPAVK